MQRGCGIQKSQGIANKWTDRIDPTRRGGPDRPVFSYYELYPVAVSPPAPALHNSLLVRSGFLIFFSCLFSLSFPSLLYAKGISFLFMINYSSNHSRVRILKTRGAHDLTKGFLCLADFQTGYTSLAIWVQDGRGGGREVYFPSHLHFKCNVPPSNPPPLALPMYHLSMFFDGPSPVISHDPSPPSSLVTVRLFFITKSLVIFCLLICFVD